MRISGVGLIGALSGLFWQAAALAQSPAVAVQTHYELYAAGLHIADVDTEFAIGARDYQMHTDYHTTGLASLFNHGKSDNTVTGVLTPTSVRPRHVFVQGDWRGDPRLADIDFSSGMPVVRQLVPPDTSERSPVPTALTTGSMDNLSALVDLMRTVAATGGCNISVRTYDGHKVIDYVTHTAGAEYLGPYRGSMFSGTALRCDFVGTPVAGVKLDDPADGKPVHGSTWLARLIPGAPPAAVRMAFETRWFGDAVMYLMSAARAPCVVVARSNPRSP